MNVDFDWCGVHAEGKAERLTDTPASHKRDAQHDPHDPDKELYDGDEASPSHTRHLSDMPPPVNTVAQAISTCITNFRNKYKVYDTTLNPKP